MAALLCSGLVCAHGGGLDERGCHNDKRAGNYHCHRSQYPASAARLPAQRNRVPMPSAPASKERVLNSASDESVRFAVVTVNNLKIRAGQSSRSKVQGRLVRGAMVKIVDSHGNWWLIDPLGPETVGYVSSRYLVPLNAELQQSSPTSIVTPRTDAEIVRDIVDESIARYRGKCPCPYSIDRAGRRCGTRSAYSRQGGASPMCFATDVPEALVRGRR